MPGYRKAVLKTYGNDLSKRWVVEYWVFSEDKKKLVRKQVFISSKKYPSAEERTAYADCLIIEINGKLHNGGYLGRQEQQIELYQAIYNYIEFKRKKVVDIKVLEHLFYRVFYPFFSTGEKELKLTDLTKADIVVFLDENQKKHNWENSTRNYKRSFLFNFFDYYHDRGIIESNPVQSIKRFKSVAPLKNFPFLDTEVGDIFDYLKKNDIEVYLTACFIYYCFIRPKEVRFLKIADIDLESGKIRVGSKISKVSKTNFVLIPKHFKAILKGSGLLDFPGYHYIFRNKNRKGEPPYGHYNIQKRFREILDQLGYDHNYGLYSFKHTGCCKLYRLTKDIKLVSRQCRHTNISTTDVYLRELGIYTEATDLDGFT